MVTEKEKYQVLDLKPENIFTFSEGIPGFEQVKRFVILTDPEEAPFGRLSAVDFDLCFFIVNPFLLCPEYAPDIDDGEIEKIGSPKQDQLLILSIVTAGDDPRETTMNLVAPLIINVKDGIGKQLIINNFKEYSPKFKIWDREIKKTE